MVTLWFGVSTSHLWVLWSPRVIDPGVKEIFEARFRLKPEAVHGTVGPRLLAEAEAAGQGEPEHGGAPCQRAPGLL